MADNPLYGPLEGLEWPPTCHSSSSSLKTLNTKVSVMQELIKSVQMEMKILQCMRKTQSFHKCVSAEYILAAVQHRASASK